MAHKIFISYARIDETFARQLAERLSQTGAQVWLDVEDIPAGMNWSSAIQVGLDEADLMIVIITPESMASQNVEHEWQYFADEKKPIIPVLLRQAKVQYQLRRTQYIDFSRQDFDKGFRRLLDQLDRPSGGHDRGAAPTYAAPTRAKRETNWTKWGVISAAAVGLLAVVATIAQPFVSDLLSNDPTLEPTIVVIAPTVTQTTSSTTATDTPPAISGDVAADFRLMWDENSLTILINGRTDLNDLSLNTINSDGSENRQSITQLFPTLRDQGFTVDTAGMCLRLYPIGRDSVTPMACSPDSLFEREINVGEVFWYDDTANLLNNMIVKRGEETVAICSAANVRGCDVKS